jgi:hypothetical protein
MDGETTFFQQKQLSKYLPVPYLKTPACAGVFICK